MIPIYNPDPRGARKALLIERLLANRITMVELSELSLVVDAGDLAHIIRKIYDLNEKTILGLAALSAAMRLFDNRKNDRRNRRFIRKIRHGFRDGSNKERKVVLAEGDSWFNYPVILTDVVDALGMDSNIAVYSIAKGGDWLLNMLTGRQYVEELSVLVPDIFLISGGGNDIVGSSRLGAIVQKAAADPNPEYEASEFCRFLMTRARTDLYAFDKAKFERGIRFLAKDFFSLLMFFHLQYFFMMNGILNGGQTGKTKFPGIRILTQGYDFPIPSLNKGFGPNPFKWYVPFVRLFLGHGSWLKIPLEKRGIYDPEDQKSILYAMIYLFNEMMINVGGSFNAETRRVFHIDSRNSVGDDGWTDELHALPKHFLDTGKVFAFCIHDEGGRHATYDHVYMVTQLTAKP
ncbi:MAG TPA: hypothetical protein VHE54_04795 [Puia sp.]|nr:hypothetical protein [Puia sp.]